MWLLCTCYVVIDHGILGRMFNSPNTQDSSGNLLWGGPLTFLANMAIAFTRCPSVRPLMAASTIVEVFETIIATGLKSYEHV